MKRNKYILIAALALALTGCENMVDGLNSDPNNVAATDVDAGLYMNTPELALVDEQCGLFSRLSAMWSGQLIGTNSVPLTHYQYQVTENSFDFDNFHNVITQCKFIQQQAPENDLYQGMTRVMEALLFGTYASFYGDVPCSEVTSDIQYPKFDAQADVFTYSQNLLDSAISYLNKVTQPQYRQDYFYSGNPQKWEEAAYTLKARFYTMTKEYDKAYTAALHGISSDKNSMYFVPVNDDQTTNKNVYYEYNSIIQGMSTSDLTGKQCYMFDLMDERDNSKTDETARKAYYKMTSTDPTHDNGISGPLEHEPLVTYAENLLILAETAARTQGFAAGLSYLNQLRSFLNDGGQLNSTYKTLPHKYDAYTADDFASGGLVNKDGLSSDRALLREIIKERYITGFTMFMPFDDARRLRGTKETDIAVDIPLNTSSATRQPERFLYPDGEMLSNPNAPEDPGLYSATPVNQK